MFRKMFIILYDDFEKKALKQDIWVDHYIVCGEHGAPLLFTTADEADAYREDNEIDSLIIEIPVNENTK